jgi:hypothetical protein
MKIDYKKTADLYAKNNYVLIKNFISKELAGFIYEYTLLKSQAVKTMIDTEFMPDNTLLGTFQDSQVPGVYSAYGDFVMETLLQKSNEGMKKITGLNLLPTYSYYRVYLKGSELKRHKDRPSCEVSTTLCLGYDNKGAPKNYNWGMYIEKSGKHGLKGKELKMEPGDMIVYRGCLVEHWRDKFKGTNLSQVFMHYNNAKGPFGDVCKFDGRPMLGLPGDFKDPNQQAKMKELDALIVKQGYKK